MAASSADDIPTQLAALLGKEVVQIRKTDETPPRVIMIMIKIKIMIMIKIMIIIIIPVHESVPTAPF